MQGIATLDWKRMVDRRRAHTAIAILAHTRMHVARSRADDYGRIREKMYRTSDLYVCTVTLSAYSTYSSSYTVVRAMTFINRTQVDPRGAFASLNSWEEKCLHSEVDGLGEQQLVPLQHRGPGALSR